MNEPGKTYCAFKNGEQGMYRAEQVNDESSEWLRELIAALTFVPQPGEWLVFGPIGPDEAFARSMTDAEFRANYTLENESDVPPPTDDDIEAVLRQKGYDV